MKCYFCEVDLDDNNKSIEHIFINAIGGRLKSNKLLCKSCNNDSGNLLDSELAKQCNFLMNFLLLDREKGSYQKVVGKTSAGDEYILDGVELRSKSKFSLERNKDMVNVSFSGSEEKELKKYFKQLAKKYPQVKLTQVLKEVNHSKFYLNEPIDINLSIGGETVMRAIAKIATNYYMLNVGRRHHIEPILDYIIKGNSTGYVHYYYGIQNKSLNVDIDNVYHYINLVGSSKERSLYCYIELFGALKFFVLLNSDYQGRNMHYEYCSNLISGYEIETDVMLNFSRDYVKSAVNGKYVQIEDISTELNKVMKIAHKRQRERHLNRLIKEASIKTLGKYDEGVPITEDMLNEFIDEVSKSVAIYMTRKSHNAKRTYLE